MSFLAADSLFCNSSTRSEFSLLRLETASQCTSFPDVIEELGSIQTSVAYPRAASMPMEAVLFTQGIFPGQVMTTACRA